MGSAGSTNAPFRKDKLTPWKQVQKSGLGFRKRSGSSIFMRGVGEDANIPGNGAKGPNKDGSATTYVCGIVQGIKKDQDRFSLIPQLLSGSNVLVPTVVFGGVFDGHGRDGDIIAEKVAASLPNVLRDHLADTLEAQFKARQKAKAEASGGGAGCINDGSGNDPLRLETEAVHTALLKSFEGIQTMLDQEFENEVVGPMMKLKIEIEAAQKVALGKLALPSGSGTTATVMMIVADRLFVANVGDSRAVLACKNPAGPGIIAKELTSDHNVASSSPEEIESLEKDGGTIMGRHLLAPNVDGGLELTRSLGDVPLHRAGLVKHEPVIIVIPLLMDRGSSSGDNNNSNSCSNDDQNRTEQEPAIASSNSSALIDMDFVDTAPQFAFAASDGLWDNFDSQEAAKFLFNTVAKTHAEKPDVTLDVLMLDAAKLLQDESAVRATAKGRRSDDITVVIIVLAQDMLD